MDYSDALYNVKIPYLPLSFGRAISQALIAGFPTQLSGFDYRLGHLGFMVNKIAVGQVLSKYFGFSCQFSFGQLLHTHLSSSGGGIIDQIVAGLPN
jgi:hypothetical protein